MPCKIPIRDAGWPARDPALHEACRFHRPAADGGSNVYASRRQGLATSPATGPLRLTLPSPTVHDLSLRRRQAIGPANFTFPARLPEEPLKPAGLFRHIMSFPHSLDAAASDLSQILG